MSPAAHRALAFSRPVIQALTVANLVYAAVIGLLLASSFLRPDWPWEPMGFELGASDRFLPAALRVVMVLGLAGVVLVHMILRRLLAIVDTVRAGDPFVEGNVQRLQAIAWRVLGLEVLRLAVHLVAAGVSARGQHLDVGDAFSFTPWLAVLLLFVLAGVFAHGTRLRRDLEGTV